MTILTMEQLFTPFTPDEAKARLLAKLQAKGLPITDWASGGIERTHVEIEAQENSDFSLEQVQLAKSAFLGTALGDWLGIVAFEGFGLTRYPATYAKDTLALSCSASAGPYTILPGQVWAADIVSGRRYVNVTGGTLTPGGSLDLTIQAESAGADYNAGVGTIAVLLTSLPGVTCTNTGANAVQGTDQESNALLIQRCRDQWSTLGYGQNADWFRYYCRNGHAYAASVTRVRVDTAPDGSGVVNVTIAGPDGHLAGGIVTAVQASLLAKTGRQVTVNVAGATELAATIMGDAFVRAGYDAAYLAAAQAQMQSLVRSLDIGAALYLSAITEAMMSPAGIVNWSALPPTAELVPAATQVVTLSSVNSTVVVV
jgi:uncharacterized phage protein gp47/JayE